MAEKQADKKDMPCRVCGRSDFSNVPSAEIRHFAAGSDTITEDACKVCKTWYVGNLDVAVTSAFSQYDIPGGLTNGR